METKHLSYFKVENFKRFDSLEVQDIGQFNLIVGDNNVGKTSLLEALLFDENYNQFLSNIWNILGYKKIVIPKNHHHTNNYFDFFISNKIRPISFQFQYNSIEPKFRLSLVKRLRNTLNNEEIEHLGSYFAFNPTLQHLIEFDLDDVKELKFLTFGDQPETYDSYVPFVSFNVNYEVDLLNFFSQISINTQKLENLQNELKYFIPNLLSIEINNAIIPQTSILAIREKNTDLNPLAQYGDGLIKLFRYLLELEVCENKRLMIDEIDTGIHYSRMKEFLKKVLQSAKNKNVQIFATTHSKECIEYYTKALEELNMQDRGRIIRIADTKRGIKAYAMRFAEFENSLLAESEIR